MRRILATLLSIILSAPLMWGAEVYHNASKTYQGATVNTRQTIDGPKNIFRAEFIYPGCQPIVLEYEYNTLAASQSVPAGMDIKVLYNLERLQVIEKDGWVLGIYHYGGSFDIAGHWITTPDPTFVFIKEGKVEIFPFKLKPDFRVRPGDSFDYSCMQKSKHPRLFLKAGEEKWLKKRIKADTTVAKVHQAIMDDADAALSLPPLERTMKGRRMLGVSGEAMRRMFDLSYAYRLTGKKKYAKAARENMIAVCGFSDWNPSHFLDVAEMAAAVSVCYDWIFPTLNAADRKYISEAITSKAIRPADSNQDAWFYSRSNNWNQVCNAGMFCAAIAFWEDHPEESRRLVNKGVQSSKFGFSCYNPSGCYPEGYGYWEYGTSYQIFSLEALTSTFGNDAGLSETKGFLESATFMNMLGAPSGNCFSYSDNGPKMGDKYALYWFASRQNNPSLTYILNQSLRSKSPDQITRYRILPFFMKFIAQSYDSQAEPLATTSWDCRGEEPMYIYRQGWESPSDAYFAIKGGSPTSNHAHMDSGSFVYEWGGVRWSADLGHEQYHPLESAGIDLWNVRPGSTRWSVFRYKSTSHSTITLGSGHYARGYAKVICTFTEPSRKGAVIDFADIFNQTEVEKAVRTAWLDENNLLHVTDTVMAGAKDLPVVWNMTTVPGITLLGSNHARLTNGRNNMLLEVKAAVPVQMHKWSTNAGTPYESDNSSAGRVGFTATIPAGQQVVFEVTLKNLP